MLRREAIEGSQSDGLAVAFWQTRASILSPLYIMSPPGLFFPLHFFGLMRPPRPKIAYFSLRALKFAYNSTNSSKFGGSTPALIVKLQKQTQATLFS